MANDLTTSESGVSGNDKSMVDVEIARAVAQIQGSMAIAKKFPRDENAAIEKIKSAASRRILAEQSEYEYSRGGSKIAGPSIRAAECVAQAWGNMDTGVVELRRDTDAGESLAMAYAVDLESNYWKHITFSVPHTRDTQEGVKALTSARDIYERVMNDGSRRLRNCILAVIPGDVMDLFMEECNKTLSKDSKPLSERITVMMELLGRINVTQEMVENKYCCNLMALTERQVAQLRRIFLAVQDGIAGIEDHFATNGKPTGPARIKTTIPKPTSAKSTDQSGAAKPPVQPKPDPTAFDAAQETALRPGLTTEKPTSRPDLIKKIVEKCRELGCEKPVDELNSRCRKTFKKDPKDVTDAELADLLNAISQELDQAKGAVK